MSASFQFSPKADLPLSAKLRRTLTGFEPTKKTAPMLTWLYGEAGGVMASPKGA
jgi:hypothetical protein